MYLLGSEIPPEERAMFNIYDGSQIAGKPIALSLEKPSLAADAETDEELRCRETSWGISLGGMMAKNQLPLMKTALH